MIANNRILAEQLFALILLIVIMVMSEPLLVFVQVISVILVAVRLLALLKFKSWLAIITGIKMQNYGATLLMVLVGANTMVVGVLNATVNLLACGALLYLFTMSADKEGLRADSQAALFEHNKSASSGGQFSVKKYFLSQVLLIASGFIYNVSLINAVLFIGLLALLIFALFLHQNPSYPFKGASTLIGRQLALAIPIVIALFVIVPNLPPFWKLPEKTVAKSGLSEQMTAGDIANLVKSKRMAFRAEFFDNQLPENAELYWRAIVMEDFNGKTWKLHEQRKSESNFVKIEPPQLENRAFSYSIIAEPHHQNWLYALDQSVSLTNNIYHGLDGGLAQPVKVSKVIKYQLVKLKQTATRKLTSFELSVNTELDKDNHPQTRALSAELWQQAEQLSLSLTQPIELVYSDLILRHFQQNNFQYSLKPAVLNGDHIDDFMMETKVGFCAHFASAYSVLMRIQNIPTRIVAGYHGGEFNPRGRYFTVYDADAHAWAEYWQSDEYGNGRWLPVDPTAVVSPIRIASGIDQAIERAPQLIELPLRFVKSVVWLNSLRQQLESLDYYWTTKFLDFDYKAQRQLYQELFRNSESILIFIGIIVLLLILPVVILMLREQIALRKQLSWQHKLLLSLGKKLSATQGEDLQRKPHWTLSEYRDYLVKMAPAQKVKIEEFFHTLAYLSYANVTEEKPLRKQKQSLRTIIKSL